MQFVIPWLPQYEIIIDNKYSLLFFTIDYQLKEVKYF